MKDLENWEIITKNNVKMVFVWPVNLQKKNAKLIGQNQLKICII